MLKTHGRFEAVSHCTPAQLFCECLVDQFDEICKFIESLPSGIVPGG